MDFVHDRLEDGKALRILAVVDNFHCERLLVGVWYSMKGEDVVRFFEWACIPWLSQAHSCR